VAATMIISLVTNRKKVFKKILPQLVDILDRRRR